jgi:hypothetical protein
MRNVCCAFLLAALSFAPLECNAGSLIRLSPHTYIEQIRSLSIKEIWQSSGDDAGFVRGNRTALAFKIFDYEDKPTRGKLFSCGWMMIGSGDLGIEPVGVMIWSDLQVCDLQITGVTAISDPEDRFRMRFRCKEVGTANWAFTGTFELKVDAQSDSPKVSIAGHPIGVIRGP